MVKPVIIETPCFEDFRGWLSVPVDKSIDFRVVQINQGFSRKAGTLRGLHFQEESTRRQSWYPACMVRSSMWLLIFDRVIPLGMLMARSSPLKIRSRC